MPVAALVSVQADLVNVPVVELDRERVVMVLGSEDRSVLVVGALDSRGVVVPPLAAQEVRPVRKNDGQPRRKRK
jgi:hypothetical protein